MRHLLPEVVGAVPAARHRLSIVFAFAQWLVLATVRLNVGLSAIMSDTTTRRPNKGAQLNWDRLSRLLAERGLPRRVFFAIIFAIPCWGIIGLIIWWMAR